MYPIDEKRALLSCLRDDRTRRPLSECHETRRFPGSLPLYRVKEKNTCFSEAKTASTRSEFDRSDRLHRSDGVQQLTEDVRDAFEQLLA